MKFRIQKLKTIDSTNSYTLQHADELEDFSVITAEEQTAGRGRKGRIWASPPGDNLYFTLLIKNPAISFNELTSLPQIMALAVNQMLIQCDLKNSWIKWPNDVYINNQKVCGILCESRFQANDNSCLAIGVGINVNTSAELLQKLDNPATSMLIESPDNEPYKADEILHFVLMRFDEEFQLWSDKEKRPLIIEKWRQASGLLGKQVILQDDDKQIYGTAVDFNERGEIIIQTEKGYETFSYGDLSLRIV